jgi:hypothetical protein
MTEFMFNRRDIESLAEKLDTLGPQLSEHEQKLLVAIFSAAAERTREAGPQGTAGTTAGIELTQLREQLVNSFLPDSGQEFLIIDVRIGPDR